MPAPVPATGPSVDNPAKKKAGGRQPGSRSWNQVEGLVAFKAVCHADEKMQAARNSERFKNTKDYFDSTIIKTKDWGMWDPPPEKGTKTPEESIDIRQGQAIYLRGADLRKFLMRTVTGFAKEWRNECGDGGEVTYDKIPSGMSVLDWWWECEDKVYAVIREDIRMQTSTSVPIELKLTFRYVCPDSPYLSREHSALATDALHPDARDFFAAFGGDKRYQIDENARLESSNRGATEQQQRLVARATASVGADPRTPGLATMPQATAPRPTPRQEQAQVALLRMVWVMEQMAAKEFGIDMKNAPTALAPALPAPAASPEQTAFGSGPSAGRTELASGTRDAQGAARGDQGDDDPDGDGDDGGAEAGADADDDGDGSGGCHDSDDDDAPLSQPSPGAVHASARREASTRRASTRARKAPRRSF